MPLFNQITIVGLGLIGGSLGMAIKRRRLAREVIGLSRRAATIRQAIRCGAIDRGATNAAAAVRGAELVVLATPVETIAPLAKRLAPHMSAGSILTDVGSTKSVIVSALAHRLPNRIAFVGAHPLAGSEQRGVAAAQARLFEQATCIVTPVPSTNRSALRRVSALWQRLGARVVTMTPARHDRLLAAASHLPHVAAFCLVEATEPPALRLAPRSFLEATRVAQSDPALWDDILLTNRRAILHALHRYERALRRARGALARADRRQLGRLLRHAHAVRQTLR